MARSHAVVHSSAYAEGSEFRALSIGCQGLYVALLAQPDVNLCGVAPYLPSWWATLAGDLDEATVLDLLADLERYGFLLIDPVTSEVWFRTFMVHDRVLTQPQIAMSAARVFPAIRSTGLREMVVQSLPEGLREGWPDNLAKAKRSEATALLEACQVAQWKPSRRLTEGFPLALSEGFHEGIPLASGGWRLVAGGSFSGPRLSNFPKSSSSTLARSGPEFVSEVAR